MPDRRIVECFILDILVAIDVIMRSTENIHSSDELVREEILFAGICKEFEIIGEAMKHIVYSSKYSEVISPEWRDIIDFRNVIAHDYFGLNQDEIFAILKISTPALKDQMLGFIKLHIEKEALQDAFNHVRKDLSSFFRHQSIEELEKLLRELL